MRVQWVPQNIRTRGMGSSEKRSPARAASEGFTKGKIGSRP